MSIFRRPFPALLLAAALAAAGAARAAEPEPMATAPPTTSPATAGAPPNIADQIDAYLKTSPAAALPKDPASGVISGDEPRRVHGIVDVAVGSNGYRSAFVESVLPVGKTGTVSIAVGETRFDGHGRGGFGGPVDRQTLGLGLALGDAAFDPQDPRCHQAREDGTDVRSDPRFEGGRPYPCRTAGARTSPQ